MAREWIPQFPDGSGWDLEDTKAPYFYEHITLQVERKLKRTHASRLYKVVTIVPYTDQPHKNTYFMKGPRLEEFLERYPESIEHVVSIEQVESMPSTDEKLNQ